MQHSTSTLSVGRRPRRWSTHWPRPWQARPDNTYVRTPAEALALLLRRARAKNQAADISGMLLYSECSFFQVLEGPASAVDACFARIQVDPRHARETRIVREVIAHRSFGDWTMGFSPVLQETQERVEGLNDFFDGRACFDGLDRGRAKKLLVAFGAGRWRSTLSDLPKPPRVNP